jgi:hypothetical protein
VNILHHHLEPVEVAGFRYLHLITKAFSNVFRHYPIRSCKKGKNVFDKMLLVTGQLGPVFCVLIKVDFVHRPEGGHVMFIHFPNVFVLDGEQNKPVWVGLK